MFLVGAGRYTQLPEADLVLYNIASQAIHNTAVYFLSIQQKLTSLTPCHSPLY